MNEAYSNPPSQSVCPNCGYCPHCGRGGWGTYPIPYYPYHYTQPQIIWQIPMSGGMQGVTHGGMQGGLTFNG